MSTEQVIRRLTAIMVLDVVGYARLMSGVLPSGLMILHLDQAFCSGTVNAMQQPASRHRADEAGHQNHGNLARQN